MTEDKFYSTADIQFASFLRMKDIDLSNIVYVDEETKQCEFVFRILKDSDTLKMLQKEWLNSQTGKICRRYSHQLRVLRNDLRLKFEGKI